MSDSRNAILARIQQALHTPAPKQDIASAFQQLTQSPDTPVQPPFSHSVLDTFISAATVHGAEVHRLGGLAELPDWIASRAQQLAQQPHVVLSPNVAQLNLDWNAMALGDDIQHLQSWGVTRAFAAIAETGTVVSVSQDCPSGLLFLAQRLIVVVDKRAIVACQEDAWATLRQRFNGAMPRSVNLITGPSRTADVEQQIQVGAHGPKWTDYLIVG